MDALAIIINILLILISIVLIVAVLMQQGQRQGLGAIGGGAETFFGKNKAKGYEAKMEKITKIAATVFIVLAIVMTILTSHTATDSVSTTDEALAQLQDVLSSTETVEASASPEAGAAATDAAATDAPAADVATEAPAAATATAAPSATATTAPTATTQG